VVAPPGGAGSSEREAYDDATGTLRPFSVYPWASLRAGQSIRAPALVQLLGSTCVVTDPFAATVDAAGTLVLRRVTGERS
jgi:hypothetical protein